MSVRVLQLGSVDFSERYEICPEAQWHYEPELSLSDREYDVALIDRVLTDREAHLLARIVRGYCLFLLENVSTTAEMEFMMKSRCGRRLERGALARFLKDDLRDYYSKPYGEKFDPHAFSPSPDFHGKVVWHGFTETVLEGSFGETMRQAAFWRGNIPVEKGQAIDFWLEYSKEGDVEIELQLIQFVSGSVSSIQHIWTFSEEDMRNVVTIENDGYDGPVFASLNARGEGTLRVTALHDRYSRRGKGAFLPGGRRITADNREEIFIYSDPGDFKPPLCVYFSGYRTMEGFEGYRMMRAKGCPFMLISEPRLEGGAFYLGTPQYEELLRKAITDFMDELGFSNDQVILSGLSMGTFGALYYGTMILPSFIIVGKPLTSLGSMAEAERIRRPGGFPTSLDVMWKQYQGLSGDAPDRLNMRFWKKFDVADWSGKTFCVAYMIEDDYDSDAYRELLSHVRGSGAKVIGKGLHGRHNDDTSGIVAWFQRQYSRILIDVYGRETG